jgi:hypothetical protein
MIPAIIVDTPLNSTPCGITLAGEKFMEVLSEWKSRKNEITINMRAVFTE